MHLLTLKDWSKERIIELIDWAERIKEDSEGYYGILKGTNMVMIFQKPSTRTRISFEVAMAQLGGHAIFLDWKKTHFEISDIRDEIRCISRYADIIMVRLMRHDDLEMMAKVSSVPVINGLDEKYHPCQILSDLLTIKEKKGRLEGLKLAYIGIANNVSNSLALGCAKVGIKFILCSPERHPPSLDKELAAMLKKTNLYKEEMDPKKVVNNVDIIYTDTWIDMELFSDSKFKGEKQRRIKKFMPYQVNEKLLKKSKALVMHCLPAHPGYEITRGVIESKNSIIFDQAENRLHMQKAIILSLLGKI